MAELYENESLTHSNLQTSGFIREETELEKKDAERAIRYLEDMGLIQASGHASYEITEKGFDVAHEMSLKRERLEHEKEIKEERLQHERDLAEDRETVNSLIAYLTFGLIAVTSLDTIVRATVGLERDLGSILIASLSFVFAVTFYIELTNEGYLEKFL